MRKRPSTTSNTGSSSSRVLRGRFGNATAWQPKTHAAPDEGIDVATRMWIHDRLGRIFGFARKKEKWMLVSTEVCGDGTMNVRFRQENGALWKVSQVELDRILKSNGFLEYPLHPAWP